MKVFYTLCAILLVVGTILANVTTGPGGGGSTGGSGLSSSVLPTNNVATNSPIAGSIPYFPGAPQTNYAAQYTFLVTNGGWEVLSNGVVQASVTTNGIASFVSETDTNLTVTGTISNPGLVALVNSTNTIVVTASGVTNNTSSIYYQISITAGSAMSVKDENGNAYLTPIVGDVVWLGPQKRFTGTAVTAIAQQVLP